MGTLEKAISIASRAHQGQIDKAGEPYILHPLRVMLRCSGEEERIAAMLHDVIEDTDWTLERLRAEGFSQNVLEALDALTHRPDEDYETFVLRAAANLIGRSVKLADLEDNMDLTRIANATQEDYDRKHKYRKAFDLIKDDILIRFKCAICGEEAGSIELRRDGFRGEVHRHGPGKDFLRRPIAESTYLTVRDAIRSGDERRIFHSLDDEVTQFYCFRCDKCFCKDHWNGIVVSEDDGWSVYVIGRCPEGHDRVFK